MNIIESKLCKICLNSNTQTGLFDNPSFNKFFSHVLGIHEPPNRTWLCAWCSSTLRKIMNLVTLAEDAHTNLSRMKLNNEKDKTSNFPLTLHHNEHTDIPPSLTKDRSKTKPKHKHKISKTKHKKTSKQIKETKNGIVMNETKVKHEVNESENEIVEVKIEAINIDAFDNKIDEKDETEDKIETDDVNETHDKEELNNLDSSKRKVNSKLYAKCEQYNFTLKVLTLEEQKAELEEKKKSETYLNRKYKCEFCGIGFVTKDVYDEHNKRHQESHSRHECPLCHLRFSSAPVLAQHRLAHARRFTCAACGARARRAGACAAHARACAAPRPGVCPVCHKIFTNQNSLENHTRGVHYQKEKKFVCSYCNQKFQTKQRLAIHTRTHTGLKPYQCDLCHRSFAANSNLRNHLAAHAHARPHYCVECDKSYKTRKGLHRHLREGASHVGGKTHSCHHCLKSFASEKLLTSHISSVHSTEPDSCALCQKTFSSTANLKKHIQSAHEPPIV